MMKKIIGIAVVGGMVLLLDAQLRIRQQNKNWRSHELACCADRRGAIVPYGVGDAEDAVRALEQKVNDEYDKGTYQADWGKYRRRALEIQSQLGFTVDDDDAFDPSYDE